MISLPLQVFVATTPVDLRLSFDRLAGIVRDQLGREPRGEALFVFHNRRRTHLKLLWHNGRGYALLYTRLDRGTFRVPLAVPETASHVSVSRKELRLLLDGIAPHALRDARRAIDAAC